MSRVHSVRRGGWKGTSEKAAAARRRGWAFVKAKDGNVYILFGVLAPVLLFFVGGAVDFTRLNMVRTDLIESMDSAGLAIAQMDVLNGPEIASLSGAARETYLKEQGRKLVHENFKYENLVQNFVIDFDITQSTIAPRAEGQVRTLFLGAATKLISGTNTLPFLDAGSSVEVTRRGSGKIELALVLDTTGSMNDEINGVKKIDSLKTAVGTLVQTLYGDPAENPNARTAVVPFNAFVNPGGAAGFTSDFLDQNAEATYHGAHFLHVSNSGVVEPTTKVNHFRLFDSNANLTWRGCVYERPYPLDEIDTAPGQVTSATEINTYDDLPPGTTNSRTQTAFANAPALSLAAAEIGSVANSRFIPVFQPDGINCNQGSGGSSDDTCAYGSTNVTRNGITYNGNYFDDPDGDGTDSAVPHSPGASLVNLSEGAYGNSFVNDLQYTRTAGAALDRYLSVMNYSRRVHKSYDGSNCATSGAAQTDTNFRTWLNGRGATECTEDEFILRHGYAGWWNPTTQRYEGKYDLSVSVNETVTSGVYIQSSRGPNSGCPQAILPMTTTKAEITSYVNSMVPNGNTNSATGAMWGWRILSPEAPFTDVRPYNDNEWIKAMVLITDGNNVVSAANTHWGSASTSWGFPRERRMGATIDTASEMRDAIDDKLVRICTRMKQNGVIVYTIIFGLDEDEDEDAATAEVFRACATQPQSPYYFNAPDGEDLQEAFGAIAQDLVSLHVSR